ncbi:MAG TPA: HIT domain-containing protein [Candidatus Saccharimonadales bacterium]
MKGRSLVSGGTMYVVPNRTKYDVFEGRRVLDHLMIIPVRHSETLADLTDKEKVDMMTIIGEYETKGYNVYARGVGSVSRSVTHQHTHLIKLEEKPMKYFVHLKKPYILFNG